MHCEPAFTPSILFNGLAQFVERCQRIQIRRCCKDDCFNPKVRGFTGDYSHRSVVGRANAGKSTLLNHVLGRRDLVSTSKKAGHTKSLNFFRVGSEPGKLILVDAPGYGARGRPEWGELFDHYIQNREQLRRIYILFNAKHGLNQFDAQMLAHLSGSLLTARGTQPFTLQSIITKADLVPVKDMKTVIETMRKDIWKAAPLCLPPIVTSSEMSPPFGLDLLRKDIAKMCGLQ